MALTDNWHDQAIAQACAIGSPLLGFERNRDISPTIDFESAVGVSPNIAVCPEGPNGKSQREIDLSSAVLTSAFATRCQKIRGSLRESILGETMPSASSAPVPSVYQNIHSKSQKELDELPCGAIQLDHQGIILRYNAFEERLAGLSKERVVGKNFFKQVAPCTDVQKFYGRFREGVAAGKLHCKFRYHFAFAHNAVDVTVSLFYSDRDKTVWVFVQPLESMK
jgi:photoactive yellow protein